METLCAFRFGDTTKNVYLYNDIEDEELRLLLSRSFGIPEGGDIVAIQEPQQVKKKKKKRCSIFV